MNFLKDVDNFIDSFKDRYGVLPEISIRRYAGNLIVVVKADTWAFNQTIDLSGKVHGGLLEEHRAAFQYHFDSVFNVKNLMSKLGGLNNDN